MKRDFKVLLESAQKQKTEDFEELLLRYKPLLLKEAVIDSVFDEDLYQEYCMVFYRCVRKFSTQKGNINE